MQQDFKTLSDDNRGTRRSLADGIEVLIKHADFRNSDRAEVWTIGLPLDAKEPLAQLCVAFQSVALNVTFLVWLPTSSRCTGIAFEQNRTVNFNTVELDDASVDYSGNVVLTSGAQLRAVRVIPSRLPYKLSDLDHRILRSTINFMGIEDLVLRT
jgi:hypothetical protein